jgi:isoaspartyl peptidase/L-asparaginase-like protein (Ntn-hydrolase superfamily)/ketosteroid isomerase-like protein
MRHTFRFLLCLAGFAMAWESQSAAQTNEARTGGTESVKYAIAIHGGAGGDPTQWDESKRTARLIGLKRALVTGRDLLAHGGTAIDAVETVIRMMEDDAVFNAGRGAVVTTDGIAELDASIMSGRDGACGAVAGVTNTKNPISLARRVMSETKHVLLAGPGANRFAVEQKVPLVTPDYFLSNHFPNETDGIARQESHGDQHLGTVGCVALDSEGNLAAGTSTGGTSKKLPGRVGDSPIVGAGTFADNATCAVSGTGVGEEYIRNSVAYDVSAQMRYGGRSLDQAVTEIMQTRLKPGIGGLITVSNRGEIVMQHNTPGMSCGAADSNGRIETYLQLDRGGVTDSEATPQQQITDLLQQQTRAWNAGDIDRFMQLYWRSDELTFSSGGSITRGWDATLDRYRERYPTGQAMGTLAFSDLEFHPLGAAAMQVQGEWNLQRRDDPIGGRFTLVLQRLPVGWRIVHDHTSQRTAR